MQRTTSEKHQKMIDDHFYDKCVACYRDDVELKSCHQCIYKICHTCIIRISSLDFKTCFDPQCRYDYMDNHFDNIRYSPSYMCSAYPVKFTFDCPTCRIKRDYDISDFHSELGSESLKRGLLEFTSASGYSHGFKLVFYTILDMDSGEYTLQSFKTCPTINL